ncbi:hypothetical protein NL526_28005, partial [Klebsiella pneumoniae]|nr:hypothetical protein [Klebsiella pneumoniae]
MFRKCVAVTTRIGVHALLFLALAGRASAQTCEVDPTNAFPLPAGTGTTPSGHDMVIAPGGGYLYLNTQWGVFRATLNPDP